MFALEVDFQDGVSKQITILIPQPRAVVGSSEDATLVIPAMKELGYQLLLIRDVGRRFHCRPLPLKQGIQPPKFLSGVYDGLLVFESEKMRFVATALDMDLTVRESEPPDRAGVRVLRQASSLPAPEFPAVVVSGATEMIVSFVPGHPIYIGRESPCEVRLEAGEISSRHARMGFESGRFWIEDLGSTNGTFVRGEQIAGRVDLEAGTTVVLGRNISIMGVSSEAEMSSASSVDARAVQKPSTRRYPVLISTSEVARPARLVLPIGGVVTIGRDPASDMWLGAPYVSRRHCEISLSTTGLVILRDFSTNGTALGDGVLRGGEMLEVRGEPKVLGFGGDLTVGLCFEEAQEKVFVKSGGALESFSVGLSSSPPARQEDSSAGYSVFRGPEVALNAIRSDTLAGTGSRLKVWFCSLNLSRRIGLVLAMVAALIMAMLLGGALWSIL